MTLIDNKNSTRRHHHLYLNTIGFKVQGPVVQKPIKANPSLFLYSQMLFNADIRENFTVEEVNLEKQK